MHSSAVVANYLLDIAKRAGRSLTPMQLLKLVFLCHGWMLGLYGRPLIADQVQAWKFGPVIPDLYHAVKHCRGNPIRTSLPAPSPKLDHWEQHLVEEVYRVYGDWSGPALSHLTHAPGSPWDQTFEHGGWGLVIPNGVIKNYYGRRSSQAATAA